MNMGRFIIGALMGLTLLVISEVIRFNIEGGRTLTDSLWSLWVIPFGAVMLGITRGERNDIDH